MAEHQTQQIGNLVRDFVKAAMNSGFTWDESIAAMGVASKFLAEGAVQNGGGTLNDCVEHAAKRFREGLSQQVTVTFAMSDPEPLRKAYEATPEAADAVIGNTNIRILFKQN